jgi:flagellar basal-body rod protein FlgG
MKASRAKGQPTAVATQDPAPADRAGPGTEPAAAAPAPAPADGRNARRQREIDELVAQALYAPQMSQRTIAALQASDKAVAGLADTVAAIGAAQKVVADNLRNADTVGYKAVRIIHGDPSQSDLRQATVQLDMQQGSLESTSRPLDVAIQGEGFFQVQVPGAPGGIGYTRFGNWFVNAKGELVAGVGSSYRVLPPMSIPAGTTDVTVSQDGRVEVVRAGDTVKVTVGRLMLTQFPNPSGLKQLGGAGSCTFVETPASGTPVEGSPGENGTGQILQGYLEQSNVDLTRERLRLRFLQNWREAILRAIDGEAPPAAARRMDSAGAGIEP